MATLKQIEIPDDLFHSLERRAAAHGVSIEQQMLRDLLEVSDERTASSSEEQLVAKVGRERQELAASGVWITEEEINAAKRWGRK